MQSRLPLIYIYFPKSFLPTLSRLYNLTILFQCTSTVKLSDCRSQPESQNYVNTFTWQKSTRTLSIDIKRQTRRLLTTKTYFILWENIRAGKEVSIIKTYLSQVFKGKVCCLRHKVCLIWIKVIMVRIQKISEWTGYI